MALNGIVVFLSAFLLFLVQPILAKLILPRFGGSVAVWATCLVFFQAALLLGYALAHQLVRHAVRAPARHTHRVLLLGSLALLPIVPIVQWPWLAPLEPGVQILVLLLVTIGLPFTLLAMTSPLLQAWIARSPAARNPYRLFAVSNLASLAALLAYPWLIEPWWPTATQARAWSAAYAAYVLLLCAISLRQPVPAAAADSVDDGPATTPRQWLGWVGLAALGSALLVSTTNHLTQNIPSFPMMWVLPLVIYLASFALCFDADRWYPPRIWHAAALLALMAMAAMLVLEKRVGNIGCQIGVFLAALFVLCMFCHGELARSRPAPARLTQFYLAVSGGGVLGGALVALLAPALLSGYFEVEIGLVLMALALLWRLWPSGPIWRGAASLLVVGTATAAVVRIDTVFDEVSAISRNFYGVVSIREYGGPDEPEHLERVLVHGRVMHGQQFLAPHRRQQPTSYYTRDSGIGRLLEALSDRTIAVGAVGLGAGTIATYGKPGDLYRFYEIDEAIVRAAHERFSFIADSAATVEVEVGDGRLLLQREPDRRYDVLVVDAFSGDSIPVHLLTREAVELYLQRIGADGVIAFHLSNSHLDLRPVVKRIAADLVLETAYIADSGVEGDVSKATSDWILLARHRKLLDLPAIAAAASALPEAGAGHAWTDDYSNIVRVMSFWRKVQ